MRHSDSEETARALERVLLYSNDLRFVLIRLRELSAPSEDKPSRQADELWDEAERLVTELQKLGRSGRVSEPPEESQGN